MGVKFRRQQSIGPYVVDFCCQERKLVIEVDGEIHSRADVYENDKVRQAWLENEGYRVIRFTVRDVMTNADGVLVEMEAG